MLDVILAQLEPLKVVRLEKGFPLSVAIEHVSIVTKLYNTLKELTQPPTYEGLQALFSLALQQMQTESPIKTKLTAIVAYIEQNKEKVQEQPLEQKPAPEQAPTFGTHQTIINELSKQTNTPPTKEDDIKEIDKKIAALKIEREKRRKEVTEKKASIEVLNSPHTSAESKPSAKSDTQPTPRPRFTTHSDSMTIFNGRGLLIENYEPKQPQHEEGKNKVYKGI